jgi:hypothetical protein
MLSTAKERKTMNYRQTGLALIAVALLLALLSIWIPWPALLVLFFLVVIVPSPFGRQPRQFIKRRIEAYRLVSEYERQRKQGPAAQNPQPATGAGLPGLPPQIPGYEQGYQSQVPPSSVQPKQDPPGGYYDQMQVQYPEQVLPPVQESIEHI